MTDEIDQLTNQIDRLLSEIKSAVLATTYSDSSPLASYTPFALSEQQAGIWILVSDLAGHAVNLAAQQQCSTLILRDEQDSPQMYIRERLQYEMIATEIHRKESLWSNGTNALRTRHGALIDTLTTLSDFRLFLLTPNSGRYIVGFGQAYELKAQSLNAVDHHLQGPTGLQK